MHPGAPTSKCGSRSSARRWDRRCRPRRRRGRETDTILFARARLKGGAMTAESQQVAAGADSAATLADTGHHGHAHHGDGKLKLAVGAVGVVFGDIGTSPLYAFRETFAGHHSIDPDRLHIYGVLSLVFWSMMLVRSEEHTSELPVTNAHLVCR